MNSKFYSSPKNDSPDENIFSKVLSGMKSVFNNAGKTKIKKSMDEPDKIQDIIEDVSDPSKDPPSSSVDLNDAVSIKYIMDTQSETPKIINEFEDVLPMIETLNNADENGIKELLADDSQLSVVESVQVSEFTENTENTDLINPSTIIAVENVLKFDKGDPNIQMVDEKIETSLCNNESINVVDNYDTITPMKSSVELASVNTDPVSECIAAPTNIETGNDSLSTESKIQRVKNTPKKKGRKKAKFKEDKSKESCRTRDILEDEKDVINDVEIDSDLNRSSEVDKDELVREIKKIPTIEEPGQSKPRIVLTFRSEKTGLRSTNVKIVSDIDKSQDEHIAAPIPILSRMSLRGKPTLTPFEHLSDKCFKRSESKRRSNVSGNDADVLNSFETKLTKSANNSESDDSARSPPIARRNRRKTSSVHSDSNSEESEKRKDKFNLKRSTRCRSKESRENVLANAIARKEKFYNESNSSVPTRLSRRIKPTAKVLANRELRLGFETQNNARLALVTEKPIASEECKITRSRLKKSPEKVKPKSEIFTRRSLVGGKLKKQIQLIDSVYKVKQVSSDDEKIDSSTGQDKKYLTVDEINRCILGTVQVELGNKSSNQYNSSSEFSRSRKHFAGDSAEQTDEQREVRRLNRLKKKHLRKLGLTAVCDTTHKRKGSSKERDILTDESTMDSTNTEAIVEHLNSRTRSFELR